MEPPRCLGTSARPRALRRPQQRSAAAALAQASGHSEAENERATLFVACAEMTCEFVIVIILMEVAIDGAADHAEGGHQDALESSSDRSTSTFVTQPERQVVLSPLQPSLGRPPDASQEAGEASPSGRPERASCGRRPLAFICHCRRRVALTLPPERIQTRRSEGGEHPHHHHFCRSLF